MPHVERSAERVEAERLVVEVLETWRASAVPDPTVSFDAETLTNLVRACYRALGIDDDVGAGVTVSTIHYYRRKDILDEPGGRTSSARYGVRHLWQAVGARLAGHLGLVTLAEARTALRGADEPALLAFVAARVVDSRSRERLRQETTASLTPARPLPGVTAPTTAQASATARPLPAAFSASARQASTETIVPPIVIPLGDDGWCILPASHPAHHSSPAARAVVAALAAALRVPLR